MRSEITEDACMCEAQIVFQKKVQSTIQELSRKHILFLKNVITAWKKYLFLLCVSARAKLS